MNRLTTIRDLFRHFDWAAERVLASAETLDESKLDRPFEMGEGSLRKTVWHIWGSHWLWFRRLAGVSPRALPFDHERPGSLAELRRFSSDARAHRERLLGTLDDSRFAQPVPYANAKGESFTARVQDVLLHVCNHPVHHHAQALNMLRHNGVTKPPRIDYLFMYHENPAWPAPALSVAVVRDYFAYTDWARDRVLDVVETVDDAALDRAFEMGMGSIRRNLAHVHDAEAWWLENWTSPGDSASFPALDPTISLSDLRVRLNANGARRNDYLSRTSDDDLRRIVQATPAPGRTISFPLGVTMLQLCAHATHHRAQTINMLRHCGRSTPPTDLIARVRKHVGR